MNKAPLCLILLIWCGGGVASGKPSEGASPRAEAARRVSHRAGAENLFNFADFGAVGNGVTDNGPALQAALNAIAEAGGGTLFVPAGRYALVTPVEKDFSGLASSVTILGVESLTPVPPPTSTGEELTHGLDLLSEFAPRTGEQGIALSITGLQSLLIKDITFIGTAEVETDALVTLALNRIHEATISHCEFYGLRSFVDGGAIVQSIRSDLRIEQSLFLGSAANSAFLAPVVQNLEWTGITVADSIFMDYGQRAELYSKLDFSTPYSWVNIGNAATPTSDSPRREVVIRNVFLDEGAFFGLSSQPDQYQPTSARIDLVYITGLYMNVSNLGTAGHYFNGLENVLIENSHYGWSQNSDYAIQLLGVGNAILDQVECAASANRILADADTRKLTVINSNYAYLDSQAPSTRVIVTETPDDDPVQYVRRQFSENLGRDPDPAAHFYWSDQILRCEDDSPCVANRKAALGNYLVTAPQEKFAVSGHIVDGGGAGLAGVTVALSGSQNVIVETDAAGDYQFSNLPTSGAYTVTPYRSNYTLNPLSREIITPDSDQTLNFIATSQNSLEFSAPSYSVSEGAGTITVTVTRSGDVSSSAAIVYSATDGTAQQRSDVIPVIGKLIFEPGEVSKTFTVFMIDDAYAEGDETLVLELGNAVNCTLGDNNTTVLTITDNDTGQAANPIDDATFFVRQHYSDFFNRSADPEGLEFWSNQIISCGSDAACISDRRMNVSAAFFLSIEFQQTGFLVYRLYEAAFAQAPRHLDEFLLDTRTIGAGIVVNAPGWEELLETNKTALIKDFVARAQFREAYPNNLTPAEFVDRLDAKAGHPLSPQEISAAQSEFGAALNSAEVAARARVLRQVAENPAFTQRKLNPAFVLMQYFGYLERNPDETPDINLDGYNFWLQKLDEFGGDFRRAEMVKSFLVSAEYRARFGAP